MPGLPRREALHRSFEEDRWAPGQEDDDQVSAVLAIDPGQTTGFLSVIDGAAKAYEIDGRGNAEDFFDTWMAIWGGYDRHVIIEKYKPECGAGSSQLDALYIIGYVEGCCRGLVRLALQDRADAKQYSTNTKLKDANLFHQTATTGGHARDAARHYLYWMMTNDTARNLPERKPLKDKLLSGLRDRHTS